MPGARKDELKRLAHEHKGTAAPRRDSETKQRVTATERGREAERSGGSGGVSAAASSGGVSEGLPPSGGKKKIIEMHKEICHQLGIQDGLNMTPIQLCQVRPDFFLPEHSFSPYIPDRFSSDCAGGARPGQRKRVGAAGTERRRDNGAPQPADTPLTSQPTRLHYDVWTLCDGFYTRPPGLTNASDTLVPMESLTSASARASQFNPFVGRRPPVATRPRC